MLMDVGTGGGTGALAPTFQSLDESAFSRNLVALLEDSEDAKSLVKYTFPAISEDLSFKIPQRAMPPDPLVNIHKRTVPSSSCKEFYHVIKHFILRQSA